MHAIDPRDRIFGLNGLLMDSPLPGSMIDYKNTHLEVFTETACYALKQRLDPFAILAYAGIGWRQRPSTLPTWVPNRTCWGRNPFPFTILAGFSPRRASKSSQNNRYRAIADYLAKGLKSESTIPCGRDITLV
jgi:hypothetical protein